MHPSTRRGSSYLDNHRTRTQCPSCEAVRCGWMGAHRAEQKAMESKGCASTYFSKHHSTLPATPFSYSRWAECSEEFHETEVFCKQDFTSLPLLEEVHVGGDWKLLEALITRIRPTGLLISIHKSLIAITFMNGSIVFLLRRGCRKLRDVIGRVFSGLAIPIYAGGKFMQREGMTPVIQTALLSGCSALALYEVLLSFGLGDVDLLARGHLHCIHPLMIAVGDDPSGHFIWPRQPARFADPAGKGSTANRHVTPTAACIPVRR